MHRVTSSEALSSSEIDRAWKTAGRSSFDSAIAKEPTEASGPSVLGMGAIATLLAFTAFAIMFLLSNDLLKTLRSMSEKFRTLSLDDGTLMLLLALSSVLAIAGGVVLFSRAKSVFLFLLLISFAVSEALLPGISEGSLAIRYLLILLLASLALYMLPSVAKHGLTSIQLLGLLYLAWQITGLVVNGYNLGSILMLPVQFAVFWGILVGLSTEFDSEAAYLRFCNVMGWTGIVLTGFHLSSLVFSPQPFLAGRFRGYYSLPTNFANGYVIFVVAMLWLGLRGTRKIAQLTAAVGALAGVGMLILSGTRNSILSIAVGVCIFAVTWPKRILIIGVLVSILLGMTVLALGDAFSSHEGAVARFSKMESNTRHEVWSLTWRYITERPVIGYGIGKTGEVLGETLQSWEKADFINTHNAYLGIWLQHGIIGLLLVLAVMVGGLLKGFSVLCSKATNDRMKDLLVLPVALFAGITAGGMFEEYLTSRGSVQQITWGLSLMLVVNAARVRETSLEREEDLVWRQW